MRTVPAGWNVGSITMAGRDLLDTPIDFKGGEDLSGVEIVLTRQTTTLDGSVVDDQGQTIVDYELIVIPQNPTDRRESRRRWLRPDQTGHFFVGGLFPGKYLVAAVAAVDNAAWPDETYVEQFRTGATPVILAAGDKQTKTVHLVRSR